MGVSEVSEGKMFFFEKKNQKTFVPGAQAGLHQAWRRRDPQRSKVFCFFFSRIQLRNA